MKLNEQQVNGILIVLGSSLISLGCGIIIGRALGHDEMIKTYGSVLDAEAVLYLLEKDRKKRGE